MPGVIRAGGSGVPERRLHSLQGQEGFTGKDHETKTGTSNATATRKDMATERPWQVPIQCIARDVTGDKRAVSGNQEDSSGILRRGNEDR